MDHPIPFRPEAHAVYDPLRMGKATLYASDHLGLVATVEVPERG